MPIRWLPCANLACLYPNMSCMRFDLQLPCLSAQSFISCNGVHGLLKKNLIICFSTRMKPHLQISSFLLFFARFRIPCNVFYLLFCVSNLSITYSQISQNLWMSKCSLSLWKFHQGHCWCIILRSHCWGMDY